MLKGNTENLKINRAKGHVKGQFLAVNFQESDQYIVYIPSLEISAYGDTPAEAEDMMKNYVIKDFCTSLISQPEDLVFATLKKLGWQRNHFFKKELSKKAFIDKKGILQEFDLDPNTVIQERLMAV